MRTKVTLVLIFLNVALFFFIFKFERQWRTEAASLEARRRVLGAEAADIRLLTVATANHAGEFTLERQRDHWLLKKPFEWPANRAAVDAILNDLQLLENETSFAVKDLGKSGLSLADYGLDNPKVTLEFRSGSTTAPPVKLLIGDVTKAGNRLYVLAPSGERVHVVNRSLIDTLSQPLERLRSERVLSIEVFEARTLTLQPTQSDDTRSGAASVLRIRLRKDNAGRWSFETPIGARASKLAVDKAVNQLNALRVKSFPANPPAVTPTLRITLEGNNRLETLLLGEPVPAAATAASASPQTAGATAPAKSETNEKNTEYFARLEDRAAVFTVAVPTSLIETLRGAQVALRERRVLDFEPRAVSAITLAAPVTNQPPLLLQRLDAAPGASEGAWQVARRSDAGPGAGSQPADAELVQRLLVQLTLLTARENGFVSDAPTSADLENWGFNRPEREVTLTFANSGAGSTAAPALVLRLGTDPQRNVYARVGTPSEPEKSVYAVDPDILRELRLDPIAWRNRLVSELPANARVSALKLTDLANGDAVLADVAFNTAGEPVVSAASAAPAAGAGSPALEAVKKLAAELRRLRASRFVQQGFTERVAAADDEPWRYRLDATIVQGEAPAEQARSLTLFFTKRMGGAQQYGGARDIDAIFELGQPLIDALWPLTEGARDPGVPATPPAPAPATKP